MARGFLECGGRAKRRRRFGREALHRMPRDAEVLPSTVNYRATPKRRRATLATAVQKGSLGEVRQLLWIFSLKHDRKRMEFRRHQSAGDSRIGFHVFFRGAFIRRVENRDAECLVARFHGPADENQLSFVD